MIKVTKIGGTKKVLINESRFISAEDLDWPKKITEDDLSINPSTYKAAIVENGLAGPDVSKTLKALNSAKAVVRYTDENDNGRIVFCKESADEISPD